MRDASVAVVVAEVEPMWCARRGDFVFIFCQRLTDRHDQVDYSRELVFKILSGSLSRNKTNVQFLAYFEQLSKPLRKIFTGRHQGMKMEISRQPKLQLRPSEQCHR
jgi:hypothetical protein